MPGGSRSGSAALPDVRRYGIRCMTKLHPFLAPTPPSRLRFGRFELQVDEHRLLVDGQPAPLRARTLELLGPG